MARKTLLISSLVTTLAVASVVGLGAVKAEGTTGSQNLADKIATKFNLKSADVQKVIDEDHTAHEAERKAEMKTKLDQAVKDGKITADQETKLIAKLDEMQAAHEKARTSNSTLSAADRKAAIDKERTDFEAWLKANNIPTDIVPMMGKGMGHGGMGRHGNMDKSTNSTSTN